MDPTTNNTLPASTTRGHVAVDHPDGSPLEPSDPRVTYLRAALTARAVIDAVEVADHELPTPCRGWTVTDLVRHMSAVYRRVAVAPTGVDLAAVPGMSDVAPTDARRTIDESLALAHQNWDDAARLEAIIEAPWGPTPGGACLAIWASEFYMHAWDLAVSIGVTVDWPEPDVSIAAEMTEAGIPAERGPEVPFDDVVELTDGASPIERLVAWVGRNPAAPIQP